MSHAMSAQPFIAEGAVWFYGDLHLAHRNIIRPDYCDRPFATIEEMDAALLAQWREVVGPNDVMFHVGDLSLRRAEHVLPLLNELTGTVYLLEGNHDTKALRRIENDGALPAHVRVLRKHRDLPFEVNVGEHRVLLTHYAMEHVDIPSDVALNVHGHSHGARNLDDRHLDVSWDVFRRPLHWTEIRDIIEKTTDPNELRLAQSPAEIRDRTRRLRRPPPQ